MTSWLFTIAILFFLTPPGSNECPGGGTAMGAAKNATAVFVGKAVARQLIPRREGEGQIVAFRFKVERVWKGKLAEEVLVSTLEVEYPDGRLTLFAEDFIPKEGESYLVYVYTGEDGRLTTRSCSRSRELNGAEGDIREFGDGYLPEKK